MRSYVDSFFESEIISKVSSQNSIFKLQMLLWCMDIWWVDLYEFSLELWDGLPTFFRSSYLHSLIWNQTSITFLSVSNSWLTRKNGLPANFLTHDNNSEEWNKVFFWKRNFLAQMFLQLALLPPLGHRYPWLSNSLKTGGLVRVGTLVKCFSN